MDDTDTPTDIEAGERVEHRGTFRLYRDEGGKWRWRLVHRNGNILADSGQGYSRRIDALDGIDSVRALAPSARVALSPETDL